MKSREVDTRVQFELEEQQPPGTIVGTIPIKPHFTYRFNDKPNHFELNKTTGTITTTTEIDRENLVSDRFDLVILSSQPTYPIEVRIVILDINDNNPVFPDSSLQVSFSESANIGTRVILDTATDGDVGINDITTDYTIVSGNEDEVFRLVVTTNPSGETPYLHLETTGRFDREVKSNYELNISAQDGGSPPRFGFLQVNVTVLDVNDNPPLFDHSDYSVSLNESLPPGTTVLQVHATDNDIGDNAKITYFLSQTETQFAIDSQTGVISTMNYLNCQEECPALENCPKSCVFTVFARDYGSPRQDGRAYVTVNLLDANDHDPIIRFRFFPATAKYATVDENAQNGSVVAAVSVIDFDEGVNGETIVEIQGGNEQSHFRLESTPSFDIVRVNGILDREQISKYNLTITAKDMGIPIRSSTAFLIIHVNDVNDHEPVFEKTEYSAVLSELVPVGTFVAAIKAEDEDSGVNSQIYYSIASGNEKRWFSLDFKTGLITTAQLLNREEQDFLKLKISARDGGSNPRWAHTYLKIQVLDENDETPTFSEEMKNVVLSESAPVGSLVTVLSATDNDLGTNGSLEYVLAPETLQQYGDVFALDDTHGRLTTKIQLDREDKAVHIIKAIAMDKGIPPLSSTVTLQLNVLDVNDNDPVFYPKQYFALVTENTPVGTSLARVIAEDPDEERNGRIRYSMLSGADGKFDIEEDTGTIKTSMPIKSHLRSKYEILISAKNEERQSQEQAVVQIYVDQEANTLKFDEPLGYKFLVEEDPEGQEPNIGREVGRVSLVRNEESSDAKYTIASGNFLGWFKIEDRSGIISTAQQIDREIKSEFILIVVAFGRVGFTETVVNITILDINDYPPTFEISSPIETLLENWPVGHEVYLARCVDLDLGSNSELEFSLTINPDDTFTISKNTGMIYLNRPVKFMAGTYYKVEITARDRGIPSLASRQEIVVMVEDVNDHTPVFDQVSYETSLLESTMVNNRFFVLRATDGDSAENGHVSYQVVDGNEELKFGIFPDGQLYVRSELDREKRDYYSLTVQAKDNGTKPRSSDVSVVIHIIDENDNKPQFDNDTFIFYVAENEPPDTYIGRLTADDEDKGKNAELSFSISTNQNDFMVDPKTGLIRTLHEFDREKLVEVSGHDYIIMEAVVLDGGLTRLRAEAKVVVYVSDVNDNTPMFLRTPYHTTISEGASLQTQALRVSATDIDSGINGNVLYSISAGNSEGSFSINEASGQITVVKTLDREKTPRFVLIVLATDTGEHEHHTSTATVTIDVLDENDNSPVFQFPKQRVEISEDTPVGYSIFTFSATDADEGINGEVSYSIGAGNNKETFKIDSTAGVLFLDRPLDYEEHSIYYLNVSASDGGAPRLTTTIQFPIRVIDVNDNQPVFPNIAIVRQIEEGIPPKTPVVTITAEDKDSGINGEVTYHIKHQEPPGDHFTIKPETGVIVTTKDIDREYSDTFRLTVVASDQALPVGNRLFSEKTVTIIVDDVNDNAPMFVSMDAGVLPEDSDNGYVIMTVTAVDRDTNTNGMVTYELVEGRNDLFYLDGTSGELYLSHPANQPQVLYSLTVQATDEAESWNAKSSRNKITVIGTTKRERGPLFSASEYSGSVFENEPVGTVVLSVRAQYPSGPAGDVEYYLTAIYGNDLPQNRVFAINKKNGVITTAVVLDRDNNVQVYELEIYAVDISVRTPKTSKTKVTITVQDRNDSPPHFVNGPYKLSLFEDIPLGHTVMTISATDPDLEGELSYALVATHARSQFEIDSTSGILVLLEPLDREMQEFYSLMVQANDGVQTSRTEIIITVTDTNDNPPEFEDSVYSFDIPEEIQRGASVGKVSATDVDIGVNGQISYSVVSDWGNDVFSLNPQSGVFTLTSHLDYEQVQHYVFVVQAQDSGQPVMSSTVTVYFNVLDLNDNTPLFDPMSYSNEVHENVTVGTSIITVSATDLDSGDNGKIEYDIVGGDEDNQFGVSANGTIFTSEPLDRETHSFYNLIVSATDQAWPVERRLSSTVQVTIILKDINDAFPEFITPNTTSVLENVPVNTVVMAIKAIDHDEGRNSYIEYSLSSSADKFLLGPVDGLLRVNGPLDREIQSKYEITVIAKDRGTPLRSSSVNIVINILDENDNNPTFDPRQYNASISENASIGVSVLEVSATDQDEGLSGQVRYSIIAGDSNHDFIIGEDTGIIRVGKNLDYERKNRYTLTIQVEDAGEDVRYDTATVTIMVKDINDNPPTFLNSPHEVHIMENIETLPASLVTIAAQDADFLPNNHIHYLIKDADKSLFIINSSTGEISVMRTLDREQQSQYVLSILAMDSGSPRQTGTGTLTVVVSDLNDNKPVFEKAHYIATIMENRPSGSEVITVTASDADEGRNSILMYTLSGDHLDEFHVDPSTGTIKTHTVLDREEKDVYEVVLIARDGGLAIQHSAYVNITIKVGDENDNRPTFAEQNSSVYLPDSAAAGHFVFGASAHDPDAGLNSRLVFHLSGTDADKFQINQDTGVVKLVQKLANKPEGYNLEIHATDNSPTPLSSSTNVVVYLKPAHLFPHFLSGKRHFIFSENAENASVTTVSASSPKRGEAGKITYHIAGGRFGEAFHVDTQSGKVWLIGGLNYEVFSKYEIWIEARDNDIPYLGTAVKLEIEIIDANDNNPVFEAEVYNATVMEEQNPPQFVLVLQAEDADSGANSEIAYHLVNKETPDIPFSLDSETGKIYTKSNLDREEFEVYKLVVEAVDQGVPSRTGTATVFVTVLDKNDNPPRFTRLFSVNVTENAPLGAFVIQVTSSDKDISMNANATYSFTENPGRKFRIDPLTGNVTVAGWLDREVQDEYLLKVAAVDGSWRAETTLTITVQDENDNTPVFNENIYTFNCPELQSAISFIGQISATDQDKHGPNSIVTYSLRRPSDYFRINPSSGEILSKQVLHYKWSSKGFSPENHHTFQVVATDHGKPPLSVEVTVVINVVDSNNNPPVFEKQNYFTPVTESVRIGTSVIQVVARDNGDVGVNAQIDYQKAGGNGTKYFNVNKTTGWVTIAESLLGQKEQHLLLHVRAVDRGVPPKSSEVLLIVTITGENLHAPVFTALSYQVIVPENEPQSSEILAVTATDRDQGLNGEIVYSIVAGNDDNKFHIGRNTGFVTVQKLLDYEESNKFHLNITATDRGFQAKHTMSMLTVIITDINDNPPVFNATEFTSYVTENRPPGTYITQLIAKDADSGANAIIQYSIIQGDKKEQFSVDPQSGIIFSKNMFDYEEKNVFVLEIMASNPGSSQYSLTKLKVHINGQNEFYPQFIQPVFQFTVSESASIGSSVGTLLATDKDAGADGDLFFLFVGSSNDRGFSVQSRTGEITVARRLDRESQSRVVVSVMVKNRGSIRGNDTDEAQVVISVQDGNDPPLFSLSSYEAQVSEAAELGSKVTTVTAVDKDVHPENSHFSYSIIAGNINQVFGIDPQSGTIHNAGELDRESLAVYNLTVAAVDRGSPPQTGTSTVHILVTDINDNAPVFDPPDVIGYVMENEPAFTSVMVLSATDYDLPPNGAPFLYFLAGGRHKDLFQIDHHTGLVKTTQSIDRESIPNIELLIEVRDSGFPTQKAQHPINIMILDKNDSPSSVRALTVIVWVYNKKFYGGKIADVHPFDPDLSGNYQCTLHKGDTDMFRIPSKCDLHAVPLQNPQNYTITVRGNDGIHADVISTTYVQFMKFDNLTVENSVMMQVLNQSTDVFLMNQFQQLQKVLKDMFQVGIMILLWFMGVNDSQSHVELTLAVQTNSGSYILPKDVLVMLREGKKLLQESISWQDITIGFEPCEITPCQNGGKCLSYLELQDSLSILDSPSLVFTSPVVSRQFTCTCTKGFSGPLCQYKQNPCSPNPCLGGGTCHHDDENFQCVCPSKYQGKQCESPKTDACVSLPCQNGGTCEEAPNGSFFCLCRPDFRGTVCEQTTDSCRPNRCLNGGTCIVENPGYRCACKANYFGRHCEKSPFGFHRYSYMAFPVLKPTTNDISIILATNKQNSLLVYNYGRPSGGRSDFVALELHDGRPQFLFGGSRTAVATIAARTNVADGRWHKITVIRNGRVTSLSVVGCSNSGEVCEECSHGNASCSVSTTGHIGTLNFNNNPMYLGGVPTIDPLLEQPGQVSTDDFVGCIHSVVVNGRELDLNSPLQFAHVTPTCERQHNSCRTDIESLCGENGICEDLWFTTSCICANGLWAPNCKQVFKPISLGDKEAYIELVPQEELRRLLLKSYSYYNGHKWKRSFSRTESSSTKSLSVTFRTNSPHSLLIYASSENEYTVVQIRDGLLRYGSHLKNGNPVTLSVDNINVADGSWHTLTLIIRAGKINITLDGEWQSTDIESQIHDFLDPFLTTMTIGGHWNQVIDQRDNSIPGFQGCIHSLTVDEKVQGFNLSGGFFKMMPHGNVHTGCSEEVLGLDVAPTDPLSIGVILVIVFFIILILVIMISFLVFRRRKLRRGKTHNHIKPNGNAFLASASCENQRNYQDPGYNDPVQGDDIQRSQLPQDLVPKKMKDREVPNDRSQRPDIIEREVIHKPSSISMQRTDELSLQDASKPSNGFGMHDINGSEIPEHYDLENASSIAPSDIDIVYHYKGFRDGNVRKYKTNPHIPNYHKHNHRHSPHQFQPSPIRESPCSVLQQNSNSVAPRESPSALKMQNTPLARLSPSSELSHQTPRILTLQDISGKPLQTALLGTSQGVGSKEFKDPITNSERSLNSPVSNLSNSTISLHSRSQSGNKKKARDSGITLGLTAEEIERLNARPRNSSLVSTLDAVSSSSDGNTEKNKLAELLETNTELMEAPDSTTDESGNDSFTCSEFEYDNNYDKVHRDFEPGNMIFSKLAEEDNENEEDSAKAYDGFDSFRGSLSTLVASDDDFSNLSSYKPTHGSMLGWDYLLNWGPNFQNLVGVFKDIAELPDTVNTSSGHSKPGEEYV
ncbi:cadherin-related tumor suppressor-like [Limulus polyphemus]|uniref:Cadherin-related tumor suppressor-like n=1 Tax=Limulus polyphemus TaxID=6850 RepID=A0ABM1T1B1_LIMPO|nr:cadherin-related tumor suppressor-like [Limulus polyphemus]